MVRLRPGSIEREVRAVFTTGPVSGLSDAELVHRFVGRRDPASFEALMRRHGRMVWGVCRSLLRDDHAADDAFQAVFLVLMRKAGSVRVGDSLGRWLHGVALRVARHARADRSRRQRHEGEAVALEPVAFEGPADDLTAKADAVALVHEELGRLPASFRAPLILCHLEGLTHEQAAATLACPVGTVRSRLARGRDRLRDRLVRRGLAPAAALAAIEASAQAQAATVVPATLAAATFATAARHATGPLAVAALSTVGVEAGIGVVSPSVLTLTKGALFAMSFGSIKVAGLGVLATAVLTLGAAAVAQRVGESNTTTPTAAATSPAHFEVHKRLTDQLQQLQLQRINLDAQIEQLASQIGKLPRASSPEPSAPSATRAEPKGLEPFDARVSDLVRTDLKARAEIARLEAEITALKQALLKAHPLDPFASTTTPSSLTTATTASAPTTTLPSPIGSSTASLPSRPAQGTTTLKADAAPTFASSVSGPTTPVSSPTLPGTTATTPAPRPTPTPNANALPLPMPTSRTALRAGLADNPVSDPFAAGRNDPLSLLAEYRLARANTARTQLLRDKGVVSVGELDKLVGIQEIARARLLDQIQRNRDEITLLALEARRQEAELNRARAQAERAGAQRARNQRINERVKDAIAPEEIAQAEADCKIAEAAVQAAHVDLELILAKTRLAEGRISTLEKALENDAKGDSKPGTKP